MEWLILVVVIGALTALFVRRTGTVDDTAAPAPTRAWAGDTVTPVGQGPRNRAPERVSRQMIVGQGALLAMRMAEVDGTVTEDERQAIRSFVLDNVTGADDALADSALAAAEAGVQNAIEVELAIEGVRAFSSSQQRELLVDLLVHVAQVDGEVHPAELAFMQRIGRGLGMTEAAVSRRIALDA